MNKIRTYVIAAVCMCLAAVTGVLFTLKAQAAPSTDLTSFSSENPNSSFDEGFYVLTFSPQDQLPSSVKYPCIQVQFSQPVIALEKLGEPIENTDVLTIDPPIEGVYRWYGTSLLSFDASEAVIPQREYKITVNPNLTSIHGNTITGKREYSFHTEELKLRGITPAWDFVKQGNWVNSDDVPTDKAGSIKVYFSNEIDFDYIKDKLNVYITENGTKKMLNYTANSEGSSNSLVLNLSETIPVDTTVTVELPAGTSPAEGYYQTSSVQKKTFHTIKPFTYSRADISYYSNEYSNPVALYFSHNITPGSEEEVAKHITTNPPMAITKDNIVVYNTRIIVHGLPVTYDSEYTISVDKDLTDFFGRKLGTPVTVNVKVPKAAAFARFKGYGFGILEAQFAPKLAFEYQNITGGYYSLKKLENRTDSSVNLPSVRTSLDMRSIKSNTRYLHAVDLSPMLKETPQGLRGAVYFSADIQYKRYSSYSDRYYDDNTTNYQVVQVTDLAGTVRYAYNKALVLVTSLSTGNPVEGATVNIYRSSFTYGISYPDDLLAATFDQRESTLVATGVSDANGLCEINFNNDETSVLFVEIIKDEDRVVFNPSTQSLYRYGIETGSTSYPLSKKKVAFMFTDRGLYVPGETVTFRTIDRSLQRGDYSPFIGEYKIELTDGYWNPHVYDTVTGTTTANGTAWGKFELSEDMEPGVYYLVYYRKENGSYTSVKNIAINVQHFERLRFESRTNIVDIPYVSGDELNATISANYLGGGAMNDCNYSVTWTRTPTYFSASDDYPGYLFGSHGYSGRSYISSESGRLGADGTANVSVNSGAEEIKGRPYTYRVEAEVADAGYQTITTSSSATVHPGKFYIGISGFKGINGYARKGQTLKYDYILLTPDHEVPDASMLPTGDKCKLNIKVSHEEYKEVQQVSWNGEINTRYEYEEVVDSERSIVLSNGRSPVELTFKPSAGGYYTITLSTEDSAGNEIITEKSFYVVSSDWYWFDRSNPREIKLTPDCDTYEVGDTAQILLQSPLPAGKYMVTVEREGIDSRRLLDLTAPTSIIEVPIEDRHVPIMYVTVSSYSVRTGEPTNTFYSADLDKPASYFGATTLRVNTTTRNFNIKVTPDKPSYKPGDKATFTLHASDKKGAAVANAEITLMAVDRGVIDLINYHVPDPVAYFYNEEFFPDCIRGGDSRNYLLDPVTYEIKNLVGGDAGKMEERSNFDPTAVFMPSLTTDANGNVTCTFTWPDTLTAYRITAVGVKGNTFAINESEINVANPVSVRQVLPMELRVGDECELGVVISNLEGIAHNVKVQCNVYSGITKAGIVQGNAEIQRLPGSAAINGSSTKTISVPAERTLPLMFTLDAKSQGWVTLEFIVTSDVLNERLIVPLEIQKPYIYETVTTVGQVDSAKATGAASGVEQIIIPSAVEDGRGSLTVILDPTRLGHLTDAVSYLFHYPYGCMEQRSSAILPLVIFGDYIDVFGLNSEVLDPKEVVINEVKTWGDYQRASGGFPYWPNYPYYYAANSWVSARVGQIVAIGDKKGWNLSSYINKQSLANYILSEYTASYNVAKERNYLSSGILYNTAYGLYVASLLGKEIDMNMLVEIEGSQYADLDTLCYVALTYVQNNQIAKAKRIASILRSYTKLTTRGIDVTFRDEYYHDYWYGYYTRSKIETLALMLQLFSEVSPKDSINGNLVYELLLKNQAYGGHWMSSALTSTVLNSIYTYIDRNDLENLNFTAEAFIDGQQVAQGQFQGLGAKAVTEELDFTQSPAKDFERDVPLELKFKKDGTGSLYYTATMRYAVPADEQKARDEGISVYTYYEDVKTGNRVEGNQLVEGNVYRVHVVLSSTMDREFVAVRVPVPAGCEIVNAAFVTNGNSGNYDYEENYGYYSPYGCSNQEIYNIEVQYFFNNFYRGNHGDSFLIRAARKGTYNVPSTTAECMYQEEIFGRSNGAVWEIVSRD